MSASPVSKDQTGSFPEYFTFAYRTFSCWFVRNILLFMFLFSYFHFISSFLAQMLLRGSSSVVNYEHISMFWFLFLLCSVFFDLMIFSLCAALTVRFLTRRFISEYGDIGESSVCSVRENVCVHMLRLIEIIIQCQYYQYLFTLPLYLAFFQSQFTAELTELMGRRSASTSGTLSMHR